MHSRYRPITGCPEFSRSNCSLLRRSGLKSFSSQVLLVVMSYVCCVPGVQAAGETLEIRNTSPIAQLFGLPAMRGARSEGTQVRFTMDVANSFTGGSADSEFVFLDGETAVFSYTVRRDFSERWEAGFEVPWIVHSGGRFDGLIDEFHELFGLPDGGRPLTDRGQLDYLVLADGAAAIEIGSKTSDLGDVRGWLGFGLIETNDHSLVARVHAKLPTGRAKKLSGSGGADGALSLDFVRHINLATVGVQLSLSGGVAVLGDGDLLADRQQTFVPFGHFGLGVDLGRQLRFLGQLDAHGELFDTQLSQLGDSVLQGTLGFQYAFTPKLSVDFSLIEDLSGTLASDVIFKLALVGRL